MAGQTKANMENGAVTGIIPRSAEEADLEDIVVAEMMDISNGTPTRSENEQEH